MNPNTFYDEAVRRLPAAHIDHHESDLYIKVTPDSMKLVEEYKAHYRQENRGRQYRHYYIKATFDVCVHL